MQTCETTDRNRIVKAEGVEASWHMTAKPTGSTPTVNAAFVPREVRVLTWGDLRRERCDWMTTLPGLVHTGIPSTERRGELPAACRRNWQQRQPGAQRVMRKRMA